MLNAIKIHRRVIKRVIKDMIEDGEQLSQIYILGEKNGVITHSSMMKAIGGCENMPAITSKEVNRVFQEVSDLGFIPCGFLRTDFEENIDNVMLNEINSNHELMRFVRKFPKAPIFIVDFNKDIVCLAYDDDTKWLYQYPFIKVGK